MHIHTCTHTQGLLWSPGVFIGAALLQASGHRISCVWKPGFQLSSCVWRTPLSMVALRTGVRARRQRTRAPLRTARGAARRLADWCPGHTVETQSEMLWGPRVCPPGKVGPAQARGSEPGQAAWGGDQPLGAAWGQDAPSGPLTSTGSEKRPLLLKPCSLGPPKYQDSGKCCV